jgi:hypothetical protein
MWALGTTIYTCVVLSVNRCDSQDMWALGTTIYTCVVLSVNLEAAMIINYWTWIHHLCIWGSILLWFIFLLVWGAVHSSNSTYVNQ